ncbi:MAG: hypothetical protein K2Z80_21835 [Xanthobacteraceae bacterium]|nr:hypothetical protein [Xanthobacteraceae bacterium]
MKIRLRHLTIVMLATAATVGTASANPRMGGGVSVSVPRAPVHYGNPGAGAGSAAASAAANASRTAAEAARAGTGASGAWQVGGIDSAPRTGHIGPSGGGGGGMAPGKYGVWVNTAIGSGAPNVGAGGGGENYGPEDFLIDIHNEASTVGCTSSSCNHPNRAHGTGGPADPPVKSGSGGNSGSGPKVATTTPTGGKAPTTTLPGPTGGTTTTASQPGDPPDAKRPLTQDEHQRLVDNATRLQDETKRLDQVVRDLNELVNRASDGTLTPAQKEDLAKRGGVDAVNKQIIDTSNQSRATDKDAKRAQQEARNNDSYRYVR